MSPHHEDPEAWQVAQSSVEAALTMLLVVLLTLGLGLTFGQQLYTLGVTVVGALTGSGSVPEPDSGPWALGAEPAPLGDGQFCVSISELENVGVACLIGACFLGIFLVVRRK